jgi:DNA-binding HxlR family transcriptional regulator
MEDKMNAKNPLDYFFDLTSLKIMLVLYRDNPDVPFEALQKEIKIDNNALTQKLAELIEVDLIDVRKEGEERLFTLSPSARMSLNRLTKKKEVMC